MKKTLVVGLALGVVSLVAASAFAGASAPRAIPAQGNTYTNAARGIAGGWAQKNKGGQGIVGSSHDMSGVGADAIAGNGASFTDDMTYSAVNGVASDRQDRICVYCHHPHNTVKSSDAGGTSGTAYSPLWNRDSRSTVTYTGYNNGIMMGGSTASQHNINADVTGITGVSMLCMSCHDGVVAMNAYSQNTGISAAGQGKGDASNGSKITSTANFGTDLSNHHPMGFSYSDVTLHDDEIAKTNVVMIPAGLTAAGTNSPATTGVTIGDLLYGTNKTMECVTCHDVHNTANAPGAERFLWRSNNQSNFCLTCHLK